MKIYHKGTIILLALLLAGVGDNGKAVLQADNGTTKVTRELTNAAR